MFDIADKVAIITGASGGIGSDIVKTFAKLEAKVVAVDIKANSSKDMLFSIPNVKYEPLLVDADLTNIEGINRIVALTKDKWQRIDILVNCAGINIRKKIEEYTPEEWDKIINVNLNSVFFMTQKVAEVMKLNSYGKIISISSMMGVITWSGTGKFSLAPYSVSKAGVISLTKSFALALAQYNITVNAVCPGFVDTSLVAPLKNSPEIFKDIIWRTPIGRFAKTNEIVAPVIFLASDGSSYITGHALLVDGGWTIQ